MIQLFDKLLCQLIVSLFFSLCDLLLDLFQIVLVLFVPHNAQGSAYLVNAPFRFDSANSKDECGSVLSKPIDNIVIHLIALRRRYVDINIANLFTILVTKTTEHRMPLFRVQIGCVGNISNTGATARTTVRPNRNTILLAPRHHFAHEQHKT